MSLIPASRFWSNTWMADALRQRGLDIHIVRSDDPGLRLFYCTIYRDGQVLSVSQGSSRQKALAAAYKLTMLKGWNV